MITPFPRCCRPVATACRLLRHPVTFGSELNPLPPGGLTDVVRDFLAILLLVIGVAALAVVATALVGGKPVEPGGLVLVLGMGLVFVVAETLLNAVGVFAISWMLGGQPTWRPMLALAACRAMGYLFVTGAFVGAALMLAALFFVYEIGRAHV